MTSEPIRDGITLSLPILAPNLQTKLESNYGPEAHQWWQSSGGPMEIYKRGILHSGTPFGHFQISTVLKVIVKKNHKLVCSLIKKLKSVSEETT